LGAALPSLLDAARIFALRKTWEYAREHSRYYAATLPRRSADDVDLATLRDVPILTKRDLAENFDALRAGTGLPAYMMFTGGTTGPSQLVYGAESDLAAIYERAAEGEPGDERPLMLITTGGTLGTAPLIPGKLGLICLPLRSREGYEWAWRMLTEEHVYDGFQKRITRLRLPLPAVKQLVHLILERKYDPGLLRLEIVFTYSAYLSTGWRSRIEQVLGAPVLDTFGFTEIMAARALQCEACGQYHFDDRVIWEAVDAGSHAPVDRGIGKLLVTSLYPHGQEMPLFRYEAGDLVEVGFYCDAFGDKGLRPRGRQSHAVAIDLGASTVFPLLPTDVQELVDTDPSVARFAYTRHSGITRTDDDAFPKWRLRRLEENGQVIGQLEIEMKFSPCLFREEWLAFEQRIRAGLSELNSTLTEVLERKLMALRIVGLPPGGLAENEIFIC
jgi:hypothetical protein